MGNCVGHGGQRVDSAAQRKKTDAPTPDDKVSSDSKKSGSGKETQRQRDDGQLMTKQEDGFLSGQSLPNRTGSTVEREAVEDETQRGREEEAPATELSSEAAVMRNGTMGKATSDSKPVIKAKEGAIHIVENGYHDDHHVVENGEGNGEERRRWSFPPVLDDFNLMESDADPSDLEAIFADERLKEIEFHIKPDSPGLGISIVGGSGSPSGDLPLLIKRILPKSLAEEDGRLKQGDELVAVNDSLLVGMSKDFAINALSNMQGDVRLLVLQEY